MARAKSNIVLQSYDSIFEAEENNKGVTSLALEALHTFPEHPYSVPDNAELEQLTDSIRESGVLTPVMVLPRTDRKGNYYIISGHRRCAAAKKAGLQEVPCIIRDISMNQAIIEMVDTNIYRETILPSEKARAYEMRLAAMTGQRKSGQIEVESGKRTDQELAEQLGESRATIHRYLRLNKLVPELRFKVDQDMIPLNAGVALSYLDEKTQAKVVENMKQEISLLQAEKIKTLNAEGDLNTNNLLAVLNGREYNIITRKDSEKLLQDWITAICKQQAGILLARYGAEISVPDAARYLCNEHPIPSGFYSWLTMNYTKKGITCTMRNSKETDVPIKSYEEAGAMLKRSFEKLAAKNSFLKEKNIKQLCRDMLTKLMEGGNIDIGSEQEAKLFLQQHKKIAFESKYYRVTAQMSDTMVLFQGHFEEGLESTGCDLDFAADVLMAEHTKIAEKASEIGAKNAAKLKEIENAKQELYSKANTAMRLQLRDVILHHPTYSIEDVKDKCQKLQNGNGKDSDIMRDALTILSHHLGIAEEQPQARWLPKMSVSERKAWLSDYPAWGVWHYDPVENARYYRRDMMDGSAIIIKEIPYYATWKQELNQELQYYLLPRDGYYCTLHDCKTNESICIKHLTSVYEWQKLHPELSPIETVAEEESEEAEFVMNM